MNALAVQQVRQDKPRGTGTDDPHLCAYSHRFFAAFIARLLSARAEVSFAKNRSTTSRGTGLLSICSESAEERTAQTLISKHSTANSFLLNSRWRTQKLLRRHSVISDSTITLSDRRDGDLNDARKSTRGIPTI